METFYSTNELEINSWHLVQAWGILCVGNGSAAQAICCMGETVSLSLSSLPRNNVRGWETFFIHHPPYCSFIIVKEIGEGEGHPSVYCTLWRT